MSEDLWYRIVKELEPNERIVSKETYQRDSKLYDQVMIIDEVLA